MFILYSITKGTYIHTYHTYIVGRHINFKSICSFMLFGPDSFWFLNTFKKLN